MKDDQLSPRPTGQQYKPKSIPFHLLFSQTHTSIVPHSDTSCPIGTFVPLTSVLVCGTIRMGGVTSSPLGKASGHWPSTTRDR